MLCVRPTTLNQIDSLASRLWCTIRVVCGHTQSRRVPLFRYLFILNVIYIICPCPQSTSRLFRIRPDDSFLFNWITLCKYLFARRSEKRGVNKRRECTAWQREFLMCSTGAQPTRFDLLFDFFFFVKGKNEHRIYIKQFELCWSQRLWSLRAFLIAKLSISRCWQQRRRRWHTCVFTEQLRMCSTRLVSHRPFSPFAIHIPIANDREIVCTVHQQMRGEEEQKTSLFSLFRNEFTTAYSVRHTTTADFVTIHNACPCVCVCKEPLYTSKCERGRSEKNQNNSWKHSHNVTHLNASAFCALFSRFNCICFPPNNFQTKFNIFYSLHEMSTLLKCEWK